MRTDKIWCVFLLMGAASSLTLEQRPSRPRPLLPAALRRFGVTVSSAIPAFRPRNGDEIDRSAPITIIPENAQLVEMEIANMGIVQIMLRPDWASIGCKRFSELVENGFFNNCRFFRVLPQIFAQFGINGDPILQSQWRSATLPDDPVRRVSNARGTVVFANAGPNTRTTQIFINTRDGGNSFLDKQGFVPFGQIVKGMDIVDQLYSGYGDENVSPNQSLIQQRGNSYLKRHFPKLSYITKAVMVGNNQRKEAKLSP